MNFNFKYRPKQFNSEFLISNFIDRIQNIGHAKVIEPATEHEFPLCSNKSHIFLVDGLGKLTIIKSTDFYPKSIPCYRKQEPNFASKQNSTYNSEKFIGDYKNIEFLELIAGMICNCIFRTGEILTVDMNYIDLNSSEDYMIQIYSAAQEIYSIAHQMVQLDFNRLIEIVKVSGNYQSIKKILVNEFLSKEFNQIPFQFKRISEAMDYDMNIFLACLHDARSLYDDFINNVITKEEFEREVAKLSNEKQDKEEKDDNSKIRSKKRNGIQRKRIPLTETSKK